MIRWIFASTLAAAVCFPCNAIAAERQVAHMVYFKLKENTDDAKEKLVVACKKYLSRHEGTIYFSAGVLAKDLVRDVNDRDFDVSLNLVFRNKAAHDAYQTDPRHLEFIEENKESWSVVRVFDSYLAAPIRDEQVTRRIPLPDPAAFFAGMIRGVVVEKRVEHVVMKVTKVPEEWKHSRAKDAEAMIGQHVLVKPDDHDSIRRFVTELKNGEEVTLDVANKEGEALTILELTEGQRERVRQ